MMIQSMEAMGGSFEGLGKTSREGGGAGCVGQVEFLAAVGGSWKFAFGGAAQILGVMRGDFDRQVGCEAWA